MTPRLPLLAASGAALLALAGCGAELSSATETPPPSGPAAASPAPSPTTSASTVASPVAADDGCPVAAAALQKVMKMPEGWRIKASSIECSHGWAQSAVTAPTPEQQGDGVVLFSYDPATGAWTDRGQGSSVDCAAFGIPKRAGRDLSVCSYEN